MEQICVFLKSVIAKTVWMNTKQTCIPKGSWTALYKAEHGTDVTHVWTLVYKLSHLSFAFCYFLLPVIVP